MKKLFNKALMVILAAIMILSSAPMGSIAKTISGSPVAIVAQAASKKTHLNTTKKSIYIGKKYTLKLIDKKGKTIPASKVKWSRSNKTIASVSKSGTVTGKKAGKIKITATYKGKKYTAVITVKSAVSLSKSKVTFKAGETAKKTIKVTCKDDKGIKWKTVEGSGIVKLSQAKKWSNDTKSLYITPTGKKFGKVKIKIYSKENSNSYSYLTIDVKAPYTLKVKSKTPCIISNYKSQEEAESSIVGENALIIRKVTYKTPNTKTLVVTVDFEAARSSSLESYYFIKYRVLDKDGYLVESDTFKSKLMMVGDKVKAEITIKGLKPGSYTIEFVDYINTDSTNTYPDEPNQPDSPSDQPGISDKLSNNQVVELYKNAVSKARAEATSVIRVKDGALNYKGIVEAGNLSSVASTLLGNFLVASKDDIEVKNEPWEKELLPDASELTAERLQYVSCEEKNGKYIVTLVAKDETNPKPGTDGVGSIANIIDKDQITDAVSSVPGLQINNITYFYENVKAVATIDKSTGKLINLNLDTPCILRLDAKLAILSTMAARVGIETISEYAVYYGNEPDDGNTPGDDVNKPTEDGNLTADEALAMYQKAAKEIHEKGVAGYSKKGWQTIDSINITGSSVLQSTFKSLLEGFLTTEEDAEVKVNEKGSEDAMCRMPLSNCSEEAVKSVTVKESGSNLIITIVMKDQTNPATTDTDGLNVMSNDILYVEDIYDTIENDSTVSSVIKKVNRADVTYKGYTIKATMTKDGKFVSIEHYGPADLVTEVNTIIGNIGFSGRINFNAKYYDFRY